MTTAKEVSEGLRASMATNANRFALRPARLAALLEGDRSNLAEALRARLRPGATQVLLSRDEAEELLLRHEQSLTKDTAPKRGGQRDPQSPADVS